MGCSVDIFVADLMAIAMKAHHLRLIIWTILCTQVACSTSLMAKNDISTIYLVSVGISDYQCLKGLRLPEQDAKSVASLFSKANAKVMLLINYQATKSNIMSALTSSFARATPHDMILFYFSGHGFSGGLSTCTTNCKGGSYISFDELKSIYSKSKASRKLIIADACFSGSIRSAAKIRKPEQMFKNQHILLLLSSRTNETSFERSDMKNGFFTSFLVKGLEGGADVNRDKAVTSKELFNYVSKHVAEISKEKQHPVMWGSFSDHLVLMRNK